MDKIKIGDKEYELNKLLVVKNTDGKVHLKINGGENVDIITNETFGNDFDSTCSFKDSSIFYSLYLVGRLDKEGIIDTADILIELHTWNGEKHSRQFKIISEKDLYEQMH